MTHLAAIELSNWARFRGRHRVELGPGVWSVTARWDSDAERSNWAGKSALLAAIAYALTGEVTIAAERLEDLISRGEDGFEVKLTLSDETTICRSKRAGQSAQLVVERWPGESGKGDDAQGWLDRSIIGLSGGDALSTWFVQQKQLARLISAPPGERMGIVRPWLDLERARQCTRAAAATTIGLSSNVDKVNATLDALKGIYGDGEPGDKDLELQKQIKKLTARSEVLRVRRVELAERLDEQRAAKLVADNLAEERQSYEELVRRGKALAEAVATAKNLEIVPLERRETELGRLAAEAKSDLEQVQIVARGQFDGVCPVDCRRCPVTDDINAAGQANGERLKTAQRRHQEARRVLGEARATLDAARAAERLLDRQRAELDALRDRAAELLERIERVEAETDKAPYDAERAAQLKAEGDVVFAELCEVERQERALSAELEQREKNWLRFSEARAELAELELLRRAHIRAGAIFELAERRLAERRLAELERRENALLAAAGIDLRVALRWARETGSLAKRCGRCGTAFPATRRIKECGACGAARGAELQERLDIIPSDRSGAADDLAGLGFQIAAAAWLRGQRGAPWAVAVLDEPTEAMDRANRRALSRALVQMLGEQFEQAFVVSHDDELQAWAPRQIVVVAGSDGSRLEVL